MKTHFKRIHMHISPNRAVAVLTPAIFAPLAGAISVFAATQAGVEVSEQELTAIFIAGATIAFGKAGLWLKGWQDFEKGQEVLPADALVSANAVTALEEETSGAIDEEIDDLEQTGEHDLDIAEEPEIDVIGQHEIDEIDDVDFDAEPTDIDDDLLAEIESVLSAPAPAVTAGQG